MVHSIESDRLVESRPIEREEFERAFIEKYFLNVKRKVKVKEFIDLSQSKVDVEEPKLRLSMRILKRSMGTL